MSEIPFGIFLGLLLGVFVTILISDAVWRRDAIEHGFASYCPNTGNFAWTGKCSPTD